MVSPTATVTPVDQIASSVTVITAKDIERDQRRTAPDALATVPGLNVVQSGGPGGLTSVFMRGTNSNHTKILIDGIDVSDPSNPNRSFDLGQLLTSDIQQIEVLRGPQSGLYGADALGGVISIITKKGEGPPRATATLEGGSFGTFNQTVGLSGAQDRINYAFNVAHFRATDIPVTPLELLPPGQKAIGNNYDNMTYSTKLGADVSENLTLNAVARYTDATLHFTGDTFDPVTFASFPAAAQSTQIVHQLFTREEAVWSVLDGRIKNYFGVNYTNNWNYNISPGDAAPTITTGDRTKYDWHTVTQLAPYHTVIVGAEHETETLQTSTVSAQNVNKAAYIELQSQFANRLFLVENVRQDDNDRFGDHPTYRLAPALILPFTETKLKGSYGTGFKAPTLNQLFVSFPAFFFFANPNLKPEESVGYDAGFEQPLFNDRIRFGSTYFHNDITNLIQSVSDPVTFSSTNVNIGRATTEGTENFVAASDHRPYPGSRGLHLYACRRRDDRTGAVAPAQGKMERECHLESDRSADLVGDGAAHRQLHRRRSRIHHPAPAGAGLHRGQCCGRLRRDRPAQGFRPRRQSVQRPLPEPDRLPAAGSWRLWRYPPCELWSEVAAGWQSKHPVGLRPGARSLNPASETRWPALATRTDRDGGDGPAAPFPR